MSNMCNVFRLFAAVGCNCVALRLFGLQADHASSEQPFRSCHGKSQSVAVGASLLLHEHTTSELCK